MDGWVDRRRPTTTTRTPADHDKYSFLPLTPTRQPQNKHTHTTQPGAGEAAPPRRGAAPGRAPLRGGGGARRQALPHLRGHRLHEGRPGPCVGVAFFLAAMTSRGCLSMDGPPPYRPSRASAQPLTTTTTPSGAARIGGDGLHVRVHRPGLPPADAAAAQVQGPEARQAQGNYRQKGGRQSVATRACGCGCGWGWGCFSLGYVDCWLDSQGPTTPVRG